jgi:thiamine biosynthesis lipoprotein
MAAERRFPAMGTDAHVVVVGADAEPLLDEAEQRISELEGRWSRFRVDSEVSHLNRAAATRVEVSSDTVLLVAMAKEAWRRSAGFVDCTLLEQLVAAGYDRTLADLPAVRPVATTRERLPRSLLGPLDLEVTPTTVRLPRGVAFDPGGIGKGLAADLVADELLAAGATGACVALGGDVAVRGTSPNGAGWTVSIDHPRQGTPIARVGLAGGGVATSTSLLRRWQVGAEVRHHLLDPRTGQPSRSEIAFASVVAASAWEAEVLAKAVLLRGGRHPFDLIDGTGAHALVVDHDGRITASAGFAAHLGDRPVPSQLHPGRPMAAAS